MSKETPKLLNFLKLVQGLKEVIRFKDQLFWKDYPFPKRYESVADHTWRMAMMLIVTEKYLVQPIDLSKALKMSLIHDLPEIIAGDANPFGKDGTGKDGHMHSKQAAKKKFEAEKKAAKQIFAKLPKQQGKEFYNLWMEFEDQKTFEAKLVKAIDKIEGKLQVLEYSKGQMYKDHWNLSMKYGVETYSVDPAIEEIGNLIVEELRKEFKEFVPINPL